MNFPYQMKIETKEKRKRKIMVPSYKESVKFSVSLSGYFYFLFSLSFFGGFNFVLVGNFVEKARRTKRKQNGVESTPLDSH